MKKILISLLTVMAFFLSACEDDEISKSDVEFQIAVPESLSDKNPQLSSGTLTLTNVNTGYENKTSITSLNFTQLDIEDGVYNIKIVGELSYSTLNADSVSVTQTIGVRAIDENVDITNNSTNNIDLQLVLYKASDGFVISEIFFCGTLTPEGDQYNSDKYFELYNNSSEVLYADGLCIAETEFNTAMYIDSLKPDNRATKTAVSAVYRVTGSGTDYPVQPGTTVLICDVAIDHTANNVNSFDLSGADFEWYDEDKYDQDVDVPEVTNLEKMACTSATIWSLHNRGLKSYVLFKLSDVTAEQFVTDYAYHYDYKFIFGEYVFDMDADVWEIPNDIIIDAVECSTPSDYEWKALDASLDLTWTHSGDGDDARYGKSVKRKVSYKDGDRVVLLDTNDSATDFIATAEPSPGTVENE